MKVSVLLADKGTQNPQGTLNLLNIGWAHTVLRPAQMPIGPGQPPVTQLLTPPLAVAIFYEVDHQDCNHPIPMVVFLEDQDGRPVELPGPEGPQALVVTQNIVVASPPQVPIGSPGTGNTLLEIVPGLPLPPGAYRWRVQLNGQDHEHWRVRFYVLPPPQQPVFTIGQPPQLPPQGGA